jgi:hypothetical protein
MFLLTSLTGTMRYFVRTLVRKLKQKLFSRRGRVSYRKEHFCQRTYRSRPIVVHNTRLEYKVQIGQRNEGGNICRPERLHD